MLILMHLKVELFALEHYGAFDNLNRVAFKGSKAAGLGYINDTLMRRVWDEAFTLYGLIAEYADMPDDRSSITFYINPNAKFHDGSPITEKMSCLA